MDKIDWLAIRDLATELNRPIKTLKVIEHDPFYIGETQRAEAEIGETQRAEAEWFEEIYREYGIDRGFHLRRIHYRLATQPLPVLDWDGEPYRNDRRSWVGLLRASLYARYLGLIPVGTLADHRNPDAVICLEETPAEASVETGDPCFGGFSELSIYNKRREPSLYREPELPSLSLAESGSLPELGLLGSLMDELALPELGCLEAADPIQPYHVELWCEKTTCADILDDLARGIGSMSFMALATFPKRLARISCRESPRTALVPFGFFISTILIRAATAWRLQLPASLSYAARLPHARRAAGRTQILRGRYDDKNQNYSRRDPRGHARNARRGLHGLEGHRGVRCNHRGQRSESNGPCLCRRETRRRHKLRQRRCVFQSSHARHYQRQDPRPRRRLPGEQPMTSTGLGGVLARDAPPARHVSPLAAIGAAINICRKHLEANTDEQGSWAYSARDC
jgi:hypothetical protein